MEKGKPFNKGLPITQAIVRFFKKDYTPMVQFL